jgi:iron(III) transport system substrate-binding protein
VTMAGLAALAWAGAVRAESACSNPVQQAGFTTCADIAKAEAEGTVVLYTTDPEDGVAATLAEFHKQYPKIATNYMRLQAGALYARLMAERRASSYLVDVMQISDFSFVMDFQKRGGYLHYASPELAAYKADYKSKPEGDWAWGSVLVAGIAYNTKLVPEAQAPHTWHDLLNPAWADSISVKVTNSGLQHETWYELRRLYGDEYWTKFAELKPRAFDSYVQQFDRATNGQDKIVATAQYSGYLQFKAKGAPLAFVYPADGLPAGPETYGIVGNAPHPEAAKLFMDWFLGAPGQTAMGRAMFLNSVRDDVPPPPGGVRLEGLKLLYPADWDAFLASRPQFTRIWDKLTGMR